MSTLLAFVLGVVLMGLALPAYTKIKDRMRRHKSAVTLSENQVTTVGQVLHLAIQGSPTGITVVDRTGDVILSNGRAHELGIVHERSVDGNVWRVAQEAFKTKKPTHSTSTQTAIRGARVVASPQCRQWSSL